MSDEAERQWRQVADELRAERDSLRAQRDALMEALKEHGEHRDWCEAYCLSNYPPETCNCGFDAALLRAKEQR